MILRTLIGITSIGFALVGAGFVLSIPYAWVTEPINWRSLGDVGTMLLGNLVLGVFAAICFGFAWSGFQLVGWTAAIAKAFSL